MDNRWSDRRMVQLGVDVYQAGRKLSSCESKDIGLGGTFLAMHNAHELSANVDVHLVFHLIPESQGQERKHSLMARVVRVDESGVGLRFHEFNTIVFRSLQEILSHNSTLH